jgi:YidC/Oxa1 family membrane protein insertase
MSAATAPHDLWTILINWVQSGIGNFGWAILLATIIVKFVTSPLDFMVKYSSKKQLLVQQKCAPQIAKLQKKFGNDQQTLKVQTNALYKREGLNVGVGCLVMAINLILTMVIFFTFYSSLRKVSAYQVINEYEQIEASYSNKFYESLIDFDDEDVIVDQTTADTWLQEFVDAKDYVSNHDSSDENFEAQNEIYTSRVDAVKQATTDASNAAIEKWNSIKSSWLWIDNVWLADANVTPFPNYSSLKSAASNGGYGTYVSENINEDDYNKIASLIISSSSRTSNGYYILAISAGVLTFLSQWIAELHNKLKNKKANKLAKSADTNASTMKIMKFVMPVIMVIFVFSTGASFGIYILASNLCSLVFGEISTLIIDRLTKKKRLEVEESLEKEANRLIKKGKLQE